VLHATILALDAVFALSVLAFAAWSTRGKPARVRIPATGASLPRSEQPAGLLVDVLVRMGFKPLEAARAADQIGECRDEPLDAQVREALRVLCHGTGRAAR